MYHTFFAKDKIQPLQKNNCGFDPHSSPDPETCFKNFGTSMQVLATAYNFHTMIYNTVNTRIAGLQVFMAMFL